MSTYRVVLADWWKLLTCKLELDEDEFVGPPSIYEPSLGSAIMPTLSPSTEESRRCGPSSIGDGTTPYALHSTESGQSLPIRAFMRPSFAMQPSFVGGGAPPMVATSTPSSLGSSHDYINRAKSSMDNASAGVGVGPPVAFRPSVISGGLNATSRTIDNPIHGATVDDSL